MSIRSSHVIFLLLGMVMDGKAFMFGKCNLDDLTPESNFQLNQLTRYWFVGPSFSTMGPSKMCGTFDVSTTAEPNKLDGSSVISPIPMVDLKFNFTITASNSSSPADLILKVDYPVPYMDNYVPTELKARVLKAHADYIIMAICNDFGLFHCLKLVVWIPTPGAPQATLEQILSFIETVPKFGRFIPEYKFQPCNITNNTNMDIFALAGKILDIFIAPPPEGFPE